MFLESFKKITMRKITNAALLILISVFMVSCTCNSESSCTESHEFRLAKGVNLSHWLSQCFGWSPRETFISEADIRFIDSIGMDHVRIPMDEEEMWFEDGTKNQASFDYLHKCIGWAQKYKLKVLVDLHIVRAHHFNSQNGEGANTLFTDSVAQNNFIELWYQISDELKKYPTIIFFLD